MRTFLTIWLGQFVSLMGSKLSEFGLAFWAYKQLDSMTQTAFLVVLLYLPNIVIAPFSGAIVDRFNRRWVMLGSDLIGGLISVIALILAWFDQLQLWHIYLGIPLLATTQVFATPAYTAAIAQLVPPKHYGRVNGLTDIPLAVSQIATPLLAALLIETTGLKGILGLDVITFIISLITLHNVRVPSLSQQTQTSQPPSSNLKALLQETYSCYRYVRCLSPLFRLWMLVIFQYFTVGLFDICFWLLVLKLGSATKFGIVITTGGIGALIGSFGMSVWGGGKRPLRFITGLMAFQGLVIIVLGWSVKQSLAIACIGIFLYMFADPLLMGSNRAIWQRRVPQELQGRVFALLLMVQRGAMIPAYLIAGVLVDQIFEPFVQQNAFAKAHLGQWLGTGYGTGICIVLMGVGLIKFGVALIAAQDKMLLTLESSSCDTVATAESAL